MTRTATIPFSTDWFRGYSEEDIGNIWGGNWLRVMDTVWGDPDAQIIEDDEDNLDGAPVLHKH